MGFVVILDQTPIQYLDVETQLEEISCLMLWPWNFKTLKLWNFLFFICKQPPELSATKRNWLDENSSRSSNILQCWGKDLKSDSLRRKTWESGLQDRQVTSEPDLWPLAMWTMCTVHNQQSTWPSTKKEKLVRTLAMHIRSRSFDLRFRRLWLRSDLLPGSLTDVDLQRRLSTVCILRHMFANEIAAHSLLLCFPHTNWYSFGDKPESEVSSQLFYFHSCHM